MKFRFLGLVSIVLFSLPAFAEIWNATARLENLPDSKVKVSVIQFSLGDQSVTYRPAEVPFGNVDIEKVIFKGKPAMFITAWAHGAKTIMFRVFDPSQSGAHPICEIISFGESTEMRIRNKKFQLKVYNDENDQPTWEDCASADKRSINSLKKKSNKVDK